MQTKERRYPKHREFVGRPEAFDYLGGRHFMMLFALGLREHHRLLDFGCGSLRSGRLIIPYLASGNYYGIEPNQWLVRAGIHDELGESVLRAKEPRFHDTGECQLSVFGVSFDFIHAHSVLTHAPLTMIESFFREAEVVLTKTGMILATFVQGESDYEGAEWVYPEYATYRRGTFESVIAANGLTLHPLASAHPEQTYFVAARPDTNVQAILEKAREECSVDLSLA